MDNNITREDAERYCEFLEATLNGTINVDLNGHFYLPEYYRNMGFEKSIIRQMSAIMFPSGTTESKPSCLFECNCCNTPLIVQWDRENNFAKIKDPCPNPTGLYPFSFDIQIPSGKFVIANDLRSCFREETDQAFGFDVNRDIGSVYSSFFWAEKCNMGHVFVGNTCPSLYKDRKADSFSVKMFSKSKNSVYDICTDLWWYCLVDYETLRAGYEKYKNEKNHIRFMDHPDTYEKYLHQHKAKIVNVTPGTYRFTNYGINHNEYSKVQIVSKIQKI